MGRGPSAAVAGHFDIDWQPVKRELAGKIVGRQNEQIAALCAAHPDRFDRLEIMRGVMLAVAGEAQRMVRLFGWNGQGDGA